ncbi:MAG: PAS domain S-box protein, partial [Desulfobacteraceae bacterium]|nr:PAS domain S-box protein [Desulfobacteraceae bacterium]
QKGTTCYGLTHNRTEPCSGDEHPCTLAEILKTKRPVVVEHIHYLSTGEGRYIEIHAYPVFDSKGDCIQIIEYGIDITERKQSETERQRLTTAIEQVADGVVITDRDGTIRYVNPAFEKITGYSKEEAIGKNTRILKSGKHDEAFYKGMWDTLSRGGVWRGRFINKKKDGTLFEEESSIAPVVSESGEIISYVSVKRDMTEQIRLERQLRQAQKMEAIGTLAGGIAHDFNNILTAIIGYTELAIMKLPPESPVLKNLNEIYNAGDRAKNLIRQILTFSRKGEQKLKPLQIQFVIKEALKFLRASIPSTVELRQDIDTACEPVMADPTQIHQVIMNLCTNAYQAMRESGGVLGVKLSQVELGPVDIVQKGGIKPGAYVLLEVSDTGCGMPPAVVERIFEPYFTTKKEGEGTGLGLAVVHGIVKGYGGRISVYSEEGKGTTFRIYFPVQADPAEIYKDIGFESPDPRGNERILAVDDDTAIVEVERAILAALGYHVTTFNSSQAALQVFKEQPEKFDLVITDMTMPHMTGAKLAQELLAIRPDIPIILSTGFSELIDREKALAMGIREFIAKPFIQKDLASAVRQALDRKP